MTAALKHLQATFLTRCRDDLAVLERIGDRPPSEGARRVVHRLAGTAGMFGWDDLGSIARRIDDQWHAGCSVTPPDMNALIMALRQVAGRQ